MLLEDGKNVCHFFLLSFSDFNEIPFVPLVFGHRLYALENNLHLFNEARIAYLVVVVVT